MAVATPQKVVRSPDFKRVYSNASGARISPLDATITFSYQGELEPGVEAVQELVVVSMSIQHLAAFIQLLQTSLQAHQDKFGQITLGAGVSFGGSAFQKDAKSGAQ
jgi:hypothetical protein